jgi:hypothetical protein
MRGIDFQVGICFKNMDTGSSYGVMGRCYGATPSLSFINYVNLKNGKSTYVQVLDTEEYFNCSLIPDSGIGEIPDGGLTPQYLTATNSTACTCPSLFRDGHTHFCAYCIAPPPHCKCMGNTPAGGQQLANFNN